MPQRDDCAVFEQQIRQRSHYDDAPARRGGQAFGLDQRRRRKRDGVYVGQAGKRRDDVKAAAAEAFFVQSALIAVTDCREL